MQLTSLQSRPPTIRFTGEGISLKPTAGCEYFIEWDRLNSKDKLLEWVLHLSKKERATPRMIHVLILAACDKHKINPHVNA